MLNVSQMDSFAMARQLNQQINLAESRNNLPVVNSRPLRLGFDISSVCNIRCIFCLAEDGRKRMSDPDAFRSPEWLDPFEPLLPFINLAILSSYEAVLNPRLDEFIARFWKYRTPLQIFTNGLAFKPELAEFLLEHGLVSLWCSVHAARQQTYESIMKGSDYGQVLENLVRMKLYARRRGLLEYAPTLVFCAMRRNIEELPDYVDLAKRVGAKEIQVNYLLVTRRGTEFDHEAMCFHPDLYDFMVQKAQVKAARLGIRLNHQRLFAEGSREADTGPCFRPWEHLIVNNQGDATVCCGGCGHLGNMFEKGFAQLWNSEQLMTFRSRINSDDPPSTCRKCTRGRENPWDMTGHLTWLRGLTGDELLANVERLLAEAPRTFRESAGMELVRRNTLPHGSPAVCAA